VCREARDGACVEHAEEAGADRAGAGERIDKHGRLETRGIVKEAKTCEEVTDSSNPTTGQCKKGKCISTGEDNVCTDCAKAGEVPINGQCIGKDTASNQCQKADSQPLDENSTTCGKCTGANYFFHKGGCYLQTATPGQTICQAAGSDGTCTTCSGANGYFKNPGAAATTDSCVSCGDTTGVTVDTNKNYVGVANCAKCNAPGSLSNSGTAAATCTECAAGFLHPPSGEATSCVETCPEGYFGHTASNTKKTCQSCATPESLTPSVTGIPGCASCTYTGGDSGTLTCSECNEGKKPSLDGLHCYDCTVGNCAFCASENVCQKCISGYILDGAACTQQTCSTPDCKTCTNPKAPNEACTACVSTHYLTPTSRCISNCAALGDYYGATEGSKKLCKRCGVANCEACNEQGKCSVCKDGLYADSAGACQKCDASCKTCYGSATDCLACDAGKIMSYTTSDTTGRCIPQCAQASGAGNCETCGLTIEGAAYCSKCSQGNEYPQNGVCATKARAAPTCKDGTVENGICKVCADGFFKINGGCYSASRLPGSTVCTKAASTGGTCQTYSGEGYSIDGSGNLVECPANCGECSSSTACTTCMPGYALSGSACAKCHESCATCSGAAETCTACANGYYKVGSTTGPCTSCETDNGSVTGVSGCLSCAAPTGGSGPVLCYLVKDSTAGDSDPNLSSGAIAGISVAVIAVVGGLVGFLCWWFVCRGKA
ncbi:Variant-specific surface protein, partial [Giardia duodenalis]